MYVLKNQKMNKKILLILLIILTIGVFLRFWKLIEYPVHLTIDEVAVGYNSYSILKTLKDEHGNFLPLAFKSTGDWKPPVLVYFMVPSIAVFGLNEFGVRFPIALFGSLTVLIVFLLVKRLTKNDLISLLTSFSLAISPWHIHYSRASFEAVLALFFVILGVYFWLIGIKNNWRFLFASIASFILSSYTYHAERVFTPIFVFFLFLIYKNDILKHGKKIFLVLVFGFILSLPLALIMLGPQGQTRGMMTFLSNDIEISKDLHQPGEEMSFLDKILDNNLLILGNFWLKRYLNYWDPHFLFFKGMKLTLPSAPDSGIFYLFELPFFLIGLMIFVFGKERVLGEKSKKLITLWLLLGPLPASLANNDQHTLRSLVTIPCPQILVALGIFWFFQKVKFFSLVKKFLVFAIFGGIVGFNLIYYLTLYYIHHPIHFSEYYDYGYKELALYAWEHQKEYQKIIVDYNFGSQGPYITGVPHLYMLFYGKYDPALYQNRPDKNSNNFANFVFRPIYFPKDRLEKNTLLIGTPWSLSPKDLKEEQILKKVYFKNGVLGFLVVKTE